jgi:hypothetical protein
MKPLRNQGLFFVNARMSVWAEAGIIICQCEDVTKGRRGNPTRHSSFRSFVIPVQTLGSEAGIQLDKVQ